jgi:hypothetical protein
VEGRATIEAVQRLLSQGGRTCTACGRAVDADRPNVRMHGMWFHAACAAYTPRQARRGVAA